MSSHLKKTQWIPEFEALRCWLALWVLGSHVMGAMSYPDEMPGVLGVLRQGAWAVDVFVLLSGFVIASVLSRESFRLSHYFINRTFRIFPIFAFMCLVGAVSLVLQSTMQLPSFTSESESILNNLGWHALAHALLLHGLVPESILPYSQTALCGPAWSLSLEWQFYCVAPFIIVVFRKWLLPLFLVAFPLVMIARFNYLPYDRMGAFLSSHLEYFVGGILSFYVYQRLTIPMTKDRLLLLAGLLIVGFVPRSLHLVYRGDLLQLGAWLPWCLWFLVLTVVCSSSSGKTFTNWIYHAILRSAPVLWLGKRSYSLYLVHELVIIWTGIACTLLSLGKPSEHPVTYPIAATVLSVGCAAITYRWIEVPGIALGRQLIARFN